ncbi:MAG TPA: PAS domain-containing protein [Pyrinomonadaceae bacterium]|jgi:photoactive yellow protein|nr:PAS domain-containing protein [Pyrinomonadaceae bacterium]
MENVTAADLSRMAEEELDALPFGAIKLSPYGTVLSYNAAEGRLTGRTRERVLGRNFFLDVAPCADVQEFRGRFMELANESGTSIFREFSFEFPFEPPLTVNITLLRDRGDKSVWVLVEPSR